MGENESMTDDMCIHEKDVVVKFVKSIKGKVMISLDGTMTKTTQVGRRQRGKT